MAFTITGLNAEDFAPLYSLDNEALAARGIIRKIADAKPGYPCRITLEDAEPGEAVLLLNHESHRANTPYRSAYAIYVREGAMTAPCYVDEIPPVLIGRPIALRLFDAAGMLIGADLVMPGGDIAAAVNNGFDREDVAYIHAHNAMHGCFAAEIRRRG